MHLVTKTIKGCEYFYLVRKERRGKRVVTAQTVYVGNRQKLAELVEMSATNAFPAEATVQEIGGALVLAQIATDLGIEKIIDEICPPSRAGAAPIGARLVLSAIHRALAPRRSNSLLSLEQSYPNSALAELFPDAPAKLDNRRTGEALVRLTKKQVEAIESAVVRQMVKVEGVALSALAFDCSNFDSFAGARTPSRLLRRGHNKSGKPLRALGLGLLVTADDGLPLLTFTYPGNENDVTSFGRFLKALDRRCESLGLPVEATVAADGGNISRQMLLKLDKRARHYVMRLPCKHVELPPLKSFRTPDAERLTQGQGPRPSTHLPGVQGRANRGRPVLGADASATASWPRAGPKSGPPGPRATPGAAGETGPGAAPRQAAHRGLREEARRAGARA
ncbi:MAG: hypothetical protein QM765_39855 [Myxococcales bacterium]